MGQGTPTPPALPTERVGKPLHPESNKLTGAQILGLKVAAPLQGPGSLENSGQWALPRLGPGWER